MYQHKHHGKVIRRHILSNNHMFKHQFRLLRRLLPKPQPSLYWLHLKLPHNLSHNYNKDRPGQLELRPQRSLDSLSKPPYPLLNTVLCSPNRLKQPSNRALLQHLLHQQAALPRQLNPLLRFLLKNGLLAMRNTACQSRLHLPFPPHHLLQLLRIKTSHMLHHMPHTLLNQPFLSI